MTETSRTRKFRWLRHVAWVSAVAIFLALTTVIIFFGSGAGNPLIRRVLMRRLQALTGGRVELRTISIDWLSLRAKLKGLEIHGLEPAGTAPLFAAEEVETDLRIDSWWGRKVSLDTLVVREPHIHIRIGKNGVTNVPTPPRPRSAKPLGQTLLDLHIRHLNLENGWVLYNDVQAPLAIEGDNLHLALVASGPVDHLSYDGNLDWQNVTFTAQRFLPVPIGVSAKFTISRDGFTLQQGVMSAARFPRRRPSGAHQLCRSQMESSLPRLAGARRPSRNFAESTSPHGPRRRSRRRNICRQAIPRNGHLCGTRYRTAL